jgi:hypothetical protein
VFETRDDLGRFLWDEAASRTDSLVLLHRLGMLRLLAGPIVTPIAASTMPFGFRHQSSHGSW